MPCRLKQLRSSESLPFLSTDLDHQPTLRPLRCLGSRLPSSTVRLSSFVCLLFPRPLSSLFSLFSLSPPGLACSHSSCRCTEFGHLALLHSPPYHRTRGLRAVGRTFSRGGFPLRKMFLLRLPGFGSQPSNHTSVCTGFSSSSFLSLSLLYIVFTLSSHKPRDFLERTRKHKQLMFS